MVTKSTEKKPVKKKAKLIEDKPRENTGRPSKYDPKYCELLIKHMSKGLSFETFGPSIGVSKSSTYRWLTDDKNDSKETLENKKAFRDAKSIATDYCRLFWEKIGIDHIVNYEDAPKLNTTAWIFNMKNRFGWRDKVENTGEVTVKPYIIKKRNGEEIEMGMKTEEAED